jgi:hypothetical protein
MRKPLKPNAAFSEVERARVTAACERFIDEFLKPRRSKADDRRYLHEQ